MIKQPIVKGKTNVLFNNAMLEGRRVTFNVKFALLFHKENIVKQKPHRIGANLPSLVFPRVWTGELAGKRSSFMNKMVSKSTSAAGVSLAMAFTASCNSDQVGLGGYYAR